MTFAMEKPEKTETGEKPGPVAGARKISRSMVVGAIVVVWLVLFAVLRVKQTLSLAAADLTDLHRWLNDVYDSIGADRNSNPLFLYFFNEIRLVIDNLVTFVQHQVPLAKVELPAYKTGCDADPAKVACDYPVYNLDKMVSAKFAKSGSPAYDLVKKFNWTNDDQNTVAKYIAVDKMTPDAAAKKWVDANRAKVDAWLK